MIYSDELLFVHVPKTAGMTLTHIFVNNLTGDVFVTIPKGHESGGAKAIVIDGTRHETLNKAKVYFDSLGRELGLFKIIIPEILPFRAFWILTTKWGIEKKIAHEIIFEFVRNYSSPSYVGLKREGIIGAFKYSNEFNHDIYDCYYLALAKQENATSILTTDTDFDKLCKKIGIIYENPIPPDILKTFSAFK